MARYKVFEQGTFGRKGESVPRLHVMRFGNDGRVTDLHFSPTSLRALADQIEDILESVEQNG